MTSSQEAQMVGVVCVRTGDGVPILNYTGPVRAYTQRNDGHSVVVTVIIEQEAQNDAEG